MIEFKLKPTFATVDSCFDLVGSRQYGVCHCPVKLLTQYQPCIIVCYSVYFWLIRSFTDPAFTGSIFVCGPLHHHVLLSSIEVARDTGSNERKHTRRPIAISESHG